MTDFILDTPDEIERYRRAAILAALRMKVNHGMWPNGVAARLVLPACRKYGWPGRTAASALAWMEEFVGQHS